MNPRTLNNPLPEPVRAQLRDELHRLAPRIDREGLYPHDFLQELGAAGGLGASIPKAHGGLGLGLAEQLGIAAELGGECGSTAFLLWCQTASAWYLRHAPNADVRARYLAPVARGELLAGSGLSNLLKYLDGIEHIHLRASRDGDGYRVSGVLPWVSNLGPDHLLLTAAALVDGGWILFAVRCDAPGLSLHPCPAFSGMEGTRTLNPRLRDVHVPDADVLAQPAEADVFLERVKPGFILLQLGLGLGVAASSIASIAKANVTHAHVNQFLDDQEEVLHAELEALRARAAVIAARADAGLASLRDVLQLRAEVTELALRAANSAVLHVGARGYLMRSPVQRRLREAAFGAIFTPALKHVRKELHRLQAAEQATARPLQAQPA